ncbi:M23 family metallopeptidase [Sphingomonas sp. LY160]|uniref:M23 family metallopeptidase n=1 Tax=Sphingomonas sp. LY160 TaxID=3095342 RepID=UPI002ADEFA2A|nr:M23 family metallopeptidase [Sphingomonas sp. LY160]MEA1072827.1 M23 family metallopeptidase [Sphingomonas sp. LY160]
MTQSTNAMTGLIRSRDLFVHDGSHLRRLRLSVPAQLAMLAAMIMLLGWSAYSTAQMIAQPAPSGDFTKLAAATELRARQIEQRQAILAAMLAGDDVDVAALPETTALATLPAELAGPLARVEDATASQAAATARTLDERYAAAAAEMKRLGVSVPAQGGPFEPVGKGDATFKQLFSSWKKLDNLADSAIAVPSDKPVRTANFTSGYGIRNDPFRGAAAKHAGIDLAAPIGTPIYATADGVVTTSEYNSGGYGNLIKLDHGRGIETRYGHLSSMAVRSGQRVTRGQMIGRMGSTGRSTGSHLHYEVRIDGRAVNPIPFMKSNDYLLAMQRKGGGTHSMDAVALGGPKR